MCEVASPVRIKTEPLDTCTEIVSCHVHVKKEPEEIRDDISNDQSNVSERSDNTVSILTDDEDENDDDASSSSPTDFDCSITGVVLPSIALPVYPNNIPRCGNRLSSLTSKKGRHFRIVYFPICHFCFKYSAT